MGVTEVVLVIVIALIVFRGYRYLPQIGRSSGKALRTGSEKAKELADKTGERHGDKFDASSMGEKAGKGVREAREFRDSFKGVLDSDASSAPKAQPAPEPAKPASTTGEESASGGDSTRGT